MIFGPSWYPLPALTWTQAGAAVNRQRGFCQKAYDGLALRGILDTPHRHPESRKHFRGISQEGVEPAGIPNQSFIARLAQHRGIIEGGIAADLAFDQA